MINTLKIQSTPTFRLGRILGISAALLLTSATASFAAAPKKLTATDQLIDDQLRAQHPAPNLVTLLVDKTVVINPRFVADAAVAAINALPAGGKVLPSTVATAALTRAPQFAADIAKAALNKVYVTGITSLNTDAKKNAQATKIVTAAFAKGLANYKPGKLINGNPFTGYVDKSDIASEITFQELSAFPLTSTTALQAVVTASVKAGAKVKASTVSDLEHNGVSGAVAGAIFKGAGTNNSKFDDVANANSAVVKAILTTAAKYASPHALEIAQAAGYAFATTYRETHPGGRTASDLLTEQQFKDANITAIVAAINAGLSAGNQKKFAAESKVKGSNLKQTLTSRVNAGITLAYNDAAPLLRDNGSGRGGVTFVNGVATAVTPIN